MIIITVTMVRAVASISCHIGGPSSYRGAGREDSGSSRPHSPALSPLGKLILAARGSNPGALAKQGEKAPPHQATSGVPHPGTQAPWGTHAGSCWMLFPIARREEDSLVFLTSVGGKIRSFTELSGVTSSVSESCLLSPLHSWLHGLVPVDRACDEEMWGKDNLLSV